MRVPYLPGGRILACPWPARTHLLPLDCGFSDTRVGCWPAPGLPGLTSQHSRESLPPEFKADGIGEEIAFARIRGGPLSPWRVL